MYLVAAWAAIEFADVIVPNLGWPQAVVTAVIVAAATGLPIVVILAWLFDWGLDGVHRTRPEPEPGVFASVPHASTPGRTSRPWFVAMAALIIAVGSGIAVALLVNGDAEPGTSAGADDGREGGAAPAPPRTPAILGAEFGDSLLSSLSEIERAFDDAGLDSLVELGRRHGARYVAGGAIEILEPDTWRFGAATPARPGDTIEVSGIARDTSGVVAVQVDGRRVAEAEDPGPALRFDARIVVPEGRGRTSAVIVVTTRRGDLRRELPIVRLPGD